MLDIYEKSKHQPGLTLVGGGVQAKDIAEENKFENYITVPEIAACLPILVPLDNKAGYPEDAHRLKKRALDRLRFKKPEEILHTRFKNIMVFASPVMYEAHMQIFSDLLISKEGILGT